MNYQQHRLYKSRTNKVVAGVCGGVGEYLNIDATLVRLAWIFTTLLGGSGIILYIVAYFIMPTKPFGAEAAPISPPHEFAAARIFGIIFVAVGIFLLLDNLELISFHRWWEMSWEYAFPSALIVVGVLFLVRHEKKDTAGRDGTPTVPPASTGPDQTAASNAPGSEGPRPKPIRRSFTDRKLFGICGGLGEYFDIDPTIVRIACVIFSLLSGGAGILLYFLMYLVIPEQQPQWSKAQ